MVDRAHQLWASAHGAKCDVTDLSQVQDEFDAWLLKEPRTLSVEQAELRQVLGV